MGTLFELSKDRKTVVLSENAVEQQITEFLRWRGWYPVRMHVGAFVPYAKAMEAMETGKLGPRDVISMNAEGVADWLVIHANYPPIWIEVKRRGKRPTAAQMKFLRERRLMKQFAVWSDCFEDFRDWYLEFVTPWATPTVEDQGDPDGMKALPTAA